MTTMIAQLRFRTMQRRARRAPVEERVLEALRARDRAARAERADRAVLPPDDELVAYCWQAADLLECPTAFVTVVTDRHQVLKAGVNLGQMRVGQPMPLASSVCAFVIAQDDTLAVTDVAQEPLLDRCVVLGGLRAYIGAPIRLDGHPIGALAASELRPRKWTDDNQRDLTRLAGLVAVRVAELTP